MPCRREPMFSGSSCSGPASLRDFIVSKGVGPCQQQSASDDPGDPGSFTRFRPYLAHFSPVFPIFCAFSPSRRGGSNEPQAGTQGQETAGRRAKRGELRPSFAGAVGRINWVGQDDKNEKMVGCDWGLTSRVWRPSRLRSFFSRRCIVRGVVGNSS